MTIKNYITSHDSKVTLEADGKSFTVDLYSREGLDMLTNLWIKTAAQHRLMYEPKWLGRPIIQFPSDVVQIQELLWEVKPDVVIETGVAHGGSLVLSASILELIGKGKVIGIDIEIRSHNRAAIEAHPLKHRIELIEGSSVAESTVAAVKAAAGAAKSVMVVLDSNHSETHVLRELELYGPMVSPGSYIVAHDGATAWVWDIPRATPEAKGLNVLNAIHRYIETHPEFRIDESCTRHCITSSPDGYLRRLTSEEMAKGKA